MELNEEIIDTKIKYDHEHIHNCPSSYQRRNNTDELRAREAILNKLDGVVDILGYHLRRLHNSDNHMKANIKKVKWIKCGFYQTQLQNFPIRVRICSFHNTTLFDFSFQIIWNA